MVGAALPRIPHDARSDRARQAYHCKEQPMSGVGTGSPVAPKGGLSRMSRRVMNLAHIVTQNGRRLGDRVAFVWGQRSLTWRQIDQMVSALAAALSARGIAKDDRLLVHSKI